MVKLSPEEYVKELRLDEDQLDDILDEIDIAENSWKVLSNDDVITVIEKEKVFSDLVTGLGTTYCSEDHGVELTKRLNELNQLTKSSFIDWYIRWVFYIDGDDNYEEQNKINTDDEPKQSNSGWSGISWSVAPATSAKEGETWKCSNCRIINKWNDRKCLACDSLAPHAKDLPDPTTSFKPNQNNFPFGSPSATSTTTSTSNFTFGGPTNATTNSLFTSTSTSSNNPITAFTFGNVTVSAPSVKD